MTETFRVRIDRTLIRHANEVAEEIGTTPGEVVRLLFKQMVKRRAIPFPLQADTPEDEILSSPERRSKLWDEFSLRSDTAARSMAPRAELHHCAEPSAG